MINTLPLGNIYPTANGGMGTSLGIRASASSAWHGAPEFEALVSEGKEGSMGSRMRAVSNVDPAPNGNPSTSVGGAPNLLVGGLVFLALLVVLMFTAHRLGEDGEFKNIKASAYNALVIGLAAIVTIPVFKFLASKVPIPTLNAWVAAA